MTAFIILSQENRDRVVGPSLNPIERQATSATPDPAYILGLGVLTDPAHAEHHDYLTALPQMDMSDPNFPPAVEPIEE